MRNLIEVINRVIEAVPDDFEGKEELIRELEHVKRDASYTAPELIGARWLQASNVLERSLGDLVLKEGVDWAITVARIWSDKQ